MNKVFSVLALAVLLAACTAAPAAPAAPPAAPTAVPTTAPEAMVPPTEPPPAAATVQVYFTDSNRYATGTPPFEVAVARPLPAGANPPEVALAAFFQGPTDEEKAQGLEAITSGFTGVSRLEIRAGVAHVYLAGPCRSNGATYTVAQPLIATLRQFPDIRFVKLYDADGVTTDPAGESNSIPPCLEP